MGSTRLPGKVMLDLCGKTVLEHVINRVKKVKNIDEIIVATTNKSSDDIIEEVALKCGTKTFRGSEEDVLSRYYHAAKKNGADVVVRITSDCPLIDPEITGKIVDYYLINKHKFDYVSNTIVRTFPRGLDTEVFSFEALERAFNQARLQNEREHVTPYIWDNPHEFSLGYYKNDVDYSNYRWTLDTEEDYKLIKKIYEYLYPLMKDNFVMQDVLDIYEQDKRLYRINYMIEQKKI